MLKTGCPQLDSEVGGLSAGGVHLLYGGPAAAMSEFCFRFLSQGLQTGEKAALITANPAQALAAAGRASVNLGTHVRRRTLLAFDFPEDLLDNLRDVSDDADIARELIDHLASQEIDRVVIDPLAPLLFGLDPAGAARRLSSLTNACRNLAATTLLVAGFRPGAALSDRSTVLFDDVLRFDSPENAMGAIRISIEQSRRSEIAGRDIWIDPELSEQPGPRAFPPAAASWPARNATTVPPAPQAVNDRRESYQPAGNARRLLLPPARLRPRVLLLDPDEDRRQRVRAGLQVFADCFEARGIVDGYGLLCTTAPDLLVIAERLPGVAAVELVRKLRRTGRDMPIIVIGRQTRRLPDQAELVEAGADACLTEPLPMRLLQCTAANWIRRTRPAFADLVLDRDPAKPDIAPDETNCTYDCDHFRERAARQAQLSRAHNLPLSTVVVRYSGGRDTVDEVAAACAMTIRRDDLVCVAARGVAVLLAGCSDASAFVARLRARCAARASFEICSLDALGDNFEDRMGSLVEDLSVTTDPAYGGDAELWADSARRAQTIAKASMGGLGHGG